MEKLNFSETQRCDQLCFFTKSQLFQVHREHHGWPTKKNSKLYWIKCHKTVTQKKKFGAENNWLKTSYLQFIAINFRFSGRKSQSQQQLVEKTTHFTIQSRSKKPHSFYKPQRTEHYKKSTLATKSKTCFWLVSEKKHLYCIISRRPRTALWKQLESKCQYIPINVL